MLQGEQKKATQTEAEAEAEATHRVSSHSGNKVERTTSISLFLFVAPFD